jgi:hypothetical protein
MQDARAHVKHRGQRQTDLLSRGKPVHKGHSRPMVADVRDIRARSGRHSRVLRFRHVPNGSLALSRTAKRRKRCILFTMEDIKTY